MAIACIEELCKAVCELRKVPAPTLTPDARGARSATIRMHGVDIVMRQLAHPDDDCVYVSADLGEVPYDVAPEVWRVLIEANLHMIGDTAPRFSRHPAKGRARLQWACPLDEATVSDFHRRLGAMATVALEWRDGHFLKDPEAAHRWYDAMQGPLNLSAEDVQQACAHFDELHRGICAELGQEPPGQDVAVDVVRAFPLHIGEMNMTILQAVEHGCDLVFVVVLLSAPAAGKELAEVAALMDVNYQLATENRFARVGRQPGTGEFVIVHGYPMAHATPARVLAVCDTMVELAGAWRAGSALATSGERIFIQQE